MRRIDFQRCRDAVTGWPGWAALRRFFGLPLGMLLVLSACCCAGLVWVFWRGLDQWWPAYFLYAASAYSLTALCVRLPGALRKKESWMAAHPKASARLGDRELRFRLKLYGDQIINFGYGVLRIAAGVLLGSAWIGADGIYNLAQALIQLFQILRRRNPGTVLRQWRSYRLCGGLILLLHLTLTGIVFQMVNWNRVNERGEILLIATAAFAFYKLISSVLGLVKDRAHEHPVDSSVRMLKLSQAFFAMFSLQAGLLHTFGSGEAWEHWLNLASGSAVCLLTAAMGVYMLCRGSREIKTLQETKHGA